MPSYSSNWTSVGDTFIQNELLYEGFCLPFKEGCLVACCMYGGPLAIAAPDVKSQWKIWIYSQNGKLLATFVASTVFAIFWSRDQKLLVVNPSGRLLLYNALGELLHTFEMGKEVQQTKIFPYVNDTGLAILSKNNQFCAINSVNNRVLWKVQDVEKQIDVATCWTVVSNPTTSPLVLICLRTRFYSGVQETAVQPRFFDWAFRAGTYLTIEQCSHDTALLALGHDSGRVQIVGCDMSTLLYTVDFPELKFQPSSLIWCGKSVLAAKTTPTSLCFRAVDEAKSDAPAAGDSVTMISGSQATLNFRRAAASQCYVAADFDGVRVFTADAAHFICEVKSCVQRVLGFTANSPGALLFDASQKLQMRSAASCDVYAYMKIIGDQMPSAVDDCIAAAGNHFDPTMQKALLKAASMGMNLCVRYDSSGFVRVAHELRMLNAVRRRHQITASLAATDEAAVVAIPLSADQLYELSTVSLVNRLISLRQWALAVDISTFMRMSADDGVHKVLAHWCYVIMESLRKHQQRGPNADSSVAVWTEDGVAQKIFARLDAFPGVSYADIAKMAARMELQRLATLLLEKEPSVSRQVDVLLKMREADKALARAAQSQQPDLLNLVLNHLRKTMHNTRDFELLLSRIPQALALYQSQVHDEAPDRAFALYEQNDDFARLAIYHLARAAQCFDNADTARMTATLGRAARALHSLRDTSAAQLVEAAVAAVTSATAADDDGADFGLVGAPATLRDMIVEHAARDEQPKIDALRRQHRLGEKQCWLWTVQGFAKGKKWMQLEQFGRSKKSPIGYLPLIEACCKYGNMELAKWFVDKLTAYEEQLKAKILLKDQLGAARLAADRCDFGTLQNIRRRMAMDSEEWRQITAIIKSLDSNMANA